MEQYTYIKQNKANLLFCPFDRFGGKECAGPLCMGWVNEIDEHGYPTGLGRCGMVHQIVVTTPGVSTPYDTPSRFWMEVNKVEG